MVKYSVTIENRVQRCKELYEKHKDERRGTTIQASVYKVIGTVFPLLQTIGIVPGDASCIDYLLRQPIGLGPGDATPLDKASNHALAP